MCLEEAINFPFDGLYIEYELDLPPNFYTDNQCSGRTQLCFTQPFGSVCFLMLISLVLLINNFRMILHVFLSHLNWISHTKMTQMR